MTPLATSHVLPLSLGIPAETGILSSPGVPQLTPQNQQASTTHDVVLPVLPEAGTPPSQPVNPVNTGNLAGLPQTDAVSNTDGIIPKTFKLPSSVMQSMQNAVDRLNEVTPGNTTHSYGVNLLSRHEELLGFEQEAALYKSQYQQLYDAFSRLHLNLKDAQDENIHLLQEVARIRSTPPLGKPQEPATSPVDDTWRIRYKELQTELKSALESLALEKDSTRPLYEFFKMLPSALELLCQEASAQSWQKPEYYQQYFQEIIAPYLETK